MLVLGTVGSQNTKTFLVGDYESIQTVTVGAGGQSTITFSSIPQTYTHLQLRATNRSGGARVRFNSDTNTNYVRHYLYGNGTSVFSGGQTGQTSASIIDSIGAATNFFNVGILDILDYTNPNKYKTMRCLTGFEDATGSNCETFLFSGLWLSTSAVNTITLTGSADTSQYSSFALYGIK
jgi:hypothetical protein